MLAIDKRIDENCNQESRELRAHEQLILLIGRQLFIRNL